MSYLWLFVVIGGFTSLVGLICVGLCLKIYTEIMKEHTIRKRYETQGKISPQ